MKVHVCDICGKNASTLMELTEAYKTKDMEHICLSCDDILRDKGMKISDIVMNIKTHWMRQALHVLRDRLRGEDE